MSDNKELEGLRTEHKIKQMRLIIGLIVELVAIVVVTIVFMCRGWSFKSAAIAGLILPSFLWSLVWWIIRSPF